MRLVPGGAQEAQQILAGEPGRHRIHERMEIDPLVLHEIGVEDHGDPAAPCR